MVVIYLSFACIIVSVYTYATSVVSRSIKVQNGLPFWYKLTQVDLYQMM